MLFLLMKIKHASLSHVRKLYITMVEVSRSDKYYHPATKQSRQADTRDARRIEDASPFHARGYTLHFA